MNNVTKINNFNEDTSNSELVQRSQAGDKVAFRNVGLPSSRLSFFTCV